MATAEIDSNAILLSDITAGSGNGNSHGLEMRVKREAIRLPALQEVLAAQQNLNGQSTFYVGSQLWQVKLLLDYDNPSKYWGANNKDGTLFVYNTIELKDIEYFIRCALRQYAPQ